MKVSEEVILSEREFAMGAVGLSDSAGVVCAGLISLHLEKALCNYQSQQADHSASSRNKMNSLIINRIFILILFCF